MVRSTPTQILLFDFLVAKATLELARLGQSVSQSVTLFNFIIMTS